MAPASTSEEHEARFLRSWAILGGLLVGPFLAGLFALLLGLLLGIDDDVFIVGPFVSIVALTLFVTDPPLIGEGWALLAGGVFWPVFAVLLGTMTRRRTTGQAILVMAASFVSILVVTKAVLAWCGYGLINLSI